MDRTPFAGLTRLDPTDPLSTDGYSFQARNPTIIDTLLRLAVQAHRHDAHDALANPTADPDVAALDTGGTIPADTSVTIGYTLIDGDGGETALNETPQIVTTQAGLLDPDAAPTLTADTASGSLLAGSYAYAITVTDGGGGETRLGPTATVVIPPGSPTNEVVIEGLDAIVTAVGGTGWRLWRSVNGGDWGLVNDGATDTVTDDGSFCVDCNVAPPVATTGTTHATNRIQVTVPSGQPAEAVEYRIYASLDGTFASPALLGTYPIASAGVAQTYDTLTLLDGSPPPVSLAMPGASYIPWREPVANAAALPSTGNQEGDVRVTLDDQALHVWGGSSWVAVSGGGGGGGTPTVEYVTVPIEFDTAGLHTGDGILVYDPAPGDTLLALAISIDTGFNGSSPGIYVYPNDNIGSMTWLALGSQAIIGGDVGTPDDTGSYIGFRYPNNIWSPTTPNAFDGTPIYARLGNYSAGGANPGSTVGSGEIQMIVAKHP